MKLEKWQSEFVADVKEWTNRELFDNHIALLTGDYFDVDEDPTEEEVDWMIDTVEEELDYRLKDWFDDGRPADDSFEEEIEEEPVERGPSGTAAYDRW